ncbi:hydrolase 2, exosortase A system-associated [Candidatus Colwellia aromaticivorans]|uniref:hydrolase 2, exosortase A system-associated n=1 Tax=Candidatus Colwellia aromaticivorans TaxID=2267621 RepID=UPI000DF37B27|nr:hydrolase 2, exosortase A system-associated [Candidatus Colwellia aromaticivorans]
MQPQFLDSNGQSIFTIYFQVPEHVKHVKTLLVVPPFAEEMNKSRKMLSDFARMASVMGVAVLLVDLYGTGDSEGELEQATWQQWHQDVASCLAWLRENTPNVDIGLLGLRLGATLAMDITCKNEALDISDVVLWQPVINGKQFVGQFLRLRLAASVVTSGVKESAAQLQHILAESGTLEVAGYMLNSQLINDIEAINLSTVNLATEREIRLTWYEVGMPPKKDLLPVSKKLIDVWQSGSQDVATFFIAGIPYWSTQEIATCEALSVSTLHNLLGLYENE